MSKIQKLRRKIRKIKKYEQKLQKQIEQEEYQELITSVKRDGIALVYTDYAENHNLYGDKAEYWVPIIKGKPNRDQAFIMHKGTKYQYPQPLYLENLTDKDILSEIWGPREEATHVIYEDVAILPYHLPLE